jgi:hypothetical protein
VSALGEPGTEFKLLPFPLEELRACVEDSRTGHHQDIAVGQQGRWAVGDIEVTGKVRTGGPRPRIRVVDRSVACCTTVGAGVEDRASGRSTAGPTSNEA